MVARSHDPAKWSDKALASYQRARSSDITIIHPDGTVELLTRKRAAELRAAAYQVRAAKRAARRAAKRKHRRRPIAEGARSPRRILPVATTPSAGSG